MIYLDSAATTFQKPPSVARAMTNALATMSSPGRGDTRWPCGRRRRPFSAGQNWRSCFNAEDPERVVLTMNATHGLNIAIKSLVPYGGRALISGYEHNAVTRPLAALHADVSVADGPLFRPEAVAEAFDLMIRPGLDAVICSHVSNVFGFVQPVEILAEICRPAGSPPCH